MKGIDYAIKKTAAELNIPEDQAKVVVMEFWNAIYESLLYGDDTAITVRHLGTAVMSRHKLYIYLKWLIKRVKKLKANPYPDFQKQEFVMEKLLLKLRLALKHRNTIAIQYAKKFKNI